jgi:hypothetical protein
MFDFVDSLAGIEAKLTKNRRSLSLAHGFMPFLLIQCACSRAADNDGGSAAAVSGTVRLTFQTLDTASSKGGFANGSRNLRLKHSTKRGAA